MGRMFEALARTAWRKIFARANPGEPMAGRIGAYFGSGGPAHWRILADVAWAVRENPGRLAGFLRLPASVIGARPLAALPGRERRARAGLRPAVGR